MTATPKKVRQRKPQGPFSDELLDQLLAQVTDKDAESLLGESGLIGQLKKQLAERMLAEELGHHLTSEATYEGPGNRNNGAAPRRSSSVYEKYRGVFTSLQANLPAVVDQLGTLQSATIGNDMAECLLIRNTPNGPQAFFIYFLLGEDGVWRIDGM